MRITMKRIYILLILSLVVNSCQDTAVEPVVSVADDVMRFNLKGLSAQTKVNSGSFEKADRIGLYVTDYATENTPMPLQVSGNRANNTLVTLEGGVWTPERTVYWGNGKSDVYAYYPYIDQITDVNNLYFEVALDQTREAYDASDFLWTKAQGVSRSDGAVNLHMKHVMSKLTVKLLAGEDYVGSLPDDASVLLHNTVTNANINLENGSVVKDPYSSAKSIKMRNLGVRTYVDEKAVVYEAIVVPQMLERSVPLIEINSKSVSYLIEDQFNFRPGVAYTYTATLNASTTAIKVEIGCEIEDWNNPGDDAGSEGGGGASGDEGSDDGGDTMEYTDLSVMGTANCYLIQHAGNYKFKAVIGNTDAPVGNVKSVDVLWESYGTDQMPNVGDLVSSVSYKNGYICFSTPESFLDGNAVIAAKNSKGAILWSWHIWCAKEGWEEQVYYNNAGTMMDRNLGATSATPGNLGALGLLFQWGRKHPFMGSSSISSNQIALSTGIWTTSSLSVVSIYEAEMDPMMFIEGLHMPDMCWSSKKTIYDPCPAGWRVPDGGSNSVWAKAIGSIDDLGQIDCPENRGVNFGGVMGEDECIWYPGSGVRWPNLVNVGMVCSCWSCLSDSNGMAYGCNVSTSLYDSPFETWPKSSAAAVRCMKDN